jgi:hypothetical protein
VGPLILLELALRSSMSVGYLWGWGGRQEIIVEGCMQFAPEFQTDGQDEAVAADFAFARFRPDLISRIHAPMDGSVACRKAVAASTAANSNAELDGAEAVQASAGSASGAGDVKRRRISGKEVKRKAKLQNQMLTLTSGIDDSDSFRTMKWLDDVIRAIYAAVDGLEKADVKFPELRRNVSAAFRYLYYGKTQMPSIEGPLSKWSATWLAVRKSSFNHHSDALGRMSLSQPTCDVARRLTFQVKDVASTSVPELGLGADANAVKLKDRARVRMAEMLQDIALLCS